MSSSRTAPQCRFLPKRVLTSEVQQVSSDSEDEDSDCSFQYNYSFSDDKELNTEERKSCTDAPVTWSGSSHQDLVWTSSSQLESRHHTHDCGFHGLSSVPEEKSDWRDTPIKLITDKGLTTKSLSDVPEEDCFVKETPIKAVLDTLPSNAFIGSTSKRRPLGDLPGSNHKPLISSTKYAPTEVRSRVQLNMYTPLKEVPESKVINSERKCTPQMIQPIQELCEKENVPVNRTDVQSTPQDRHTPFQVLNNCESKSAINNPTLGSEKKNANCEDIYKHLDTPILIKCGQNVPVKTIINPEGSPLKINSQLLGDNLDINQMLNQNAQHESPALKTKNENVKKIKSPELPLFPKALEKPLEPINNILKTNKQETETPQEKNVDSLFKTPAAIPVVSKKAEDKKEPIMVNGKKYNVLGLIGRGGSSKVYQVSNERNLLMAIKVVDLSEADSSVVDGYKNEIELLKRLQHSNRVVKMYDYEYRGDKLFVIMEKGEDLSSLIKNRNKNKSITTEMIKFYWSEMLRAVQVIHKEGIIHSDLKPANFLLVGGCLKLIDFGIASSIQSDKTSVIKDVQTGTFNYISPEALSDTQHGPNPQYKIGIRSDIWSLGCILYNLAYQKTPFQHITKMFPKLAAIMDPNHKISFPPYEDMLLVDVLQQCLVRDAKRRPTVEELLLHPYLHHPTTPTQLTKLIQQLRDKDLTPTRISKIEKFVEKL